MAGGRVLNVASEVDVLEAVGLVEEGVEEELFVLGGLGYVWVRR